MTITVPDDSSKPATAHIQGVLCERHVAYLERVIRAGNPLARTSALTQVATLCRKVSGLCLSRGRSCRPATDPRDNKVRRSRPCTQGAA